MAAPVHEFFVTWKSAKSEDFAKQHTILEGIIAEKLVLSNKDGQATIVSQINQLLATSPTRLKGLVLLIHSTEQIVPDTFKKHALSWLEQISSLLQPHQPESVYRLACLALSALIKRTTLHTELHHQASVNVIPNLYHTLIQANAYCRKEAMKCLLSCLITFPGPAGPIKEKLVKFLVPSIVSYDSIQRLSAITCYCALPSTGGAGHEASKHGQAWSDQFDRLLASVNTLLSNAYTEHEDEEDRAADGNGLPWLVGDTEDELHVLVHRYNVATQCARMMLTSDYSYKRAVRVTAVLRTVARCLNVNGRMLEARPSTDRLRLAAVISSLHQASLSLLDGLIQCCGSNLLAHAGTVSTMYQQTLSWTRPPSTEPGRRPYARLRACVYASVVTWSEHVARGLEADDLLTEILEEARPETKSIKLDSKIHSMANLMDTKKKGKGKKSGANCVGASQEADISPDQDCISAGLKACAVLLRTCGHRLKASTLTSVQELSLRTLLACQAGLPPSPYDRPACRLHLYAVLDSLAAVRHGKWSPALHCHLRIFARGRTERCDEIRKLCVEAMAKCSSLLHPRFPVAYDAVTKPAPGKEHDTSNGHMEMDFAKPLSYEISIRNQDPIVVERNSGSPFIETPAKVKVNEGRRDSDGVDLSPKETRGQKRPASPESASLAKVQVTESGEIEPRCSPTVVKKNISCEVLVDSPTPSSAGVDKKTLDVRQDSPVATGDTEDVEIDAMLSSFQDVDPDSDE